MMRHTLSWLGVFLALGSPAGIPAQDLSGETLYFSWSTDVLAVDPTTGDRTVIRDDTYAPTLSYDGMIVSPDGQELVVTATPQFGGTAIARVQIADGSVAPIAVFDFSTDAKSVIPIHLALQTAERVVVTGNIGTEMVVVDDTDVEFISDADATFVDMPPATQSSIVYPYAIRKEASGGTFLLACVWQVQEPSFEERRGIVRFDPSDESFTTVYLHPTGFSPVSIAIDPTDPEIVYAVDGRDTVYKVDLSDATSELLSWDPVNGSGPPLAMAQLLAISSNGNLYVYDADLPGIVHVDASTGDRTIVSSSGSSPVGTGPDLNGLHGAGPQGGSAALDVYPKEQNLDQAPSAISEWMQF